MLFVCAKVTMRNKIQCLHIFKLSELTYKNILLKTKHLIYSLFTSRLQFFKYLVSVIHDVKVIFIWIIQFKGNATRLFHCLLSVLHKFNPFLIVPTTTINVFFLQLRSYVSNRGPFCFRTIYCVDPKVHAENI